MANSKQVKHRRAAKACVRCHRRKVKCDVAANGQPCANCVADEIQCEVVPRKRRAGRFSAPAPCDSLTSPSTSNTVYNLTMTPSGEQVEPVDSSEDDGRHAGALAAAIEDNQVANSADATIHYAGNAAGVVGFVADLVSDGNSASAHYLVPHTARKALAPEELQYLRFKGVFTVPSKEACDELMRVYFMHVHPLLPILDAASFLKQYNEHGYEKVNLPLLWSMIFMAAGFAEPGTLSKMGYVNRKALKRDAYSRAKVLYDTAYDDDQIALIQSVILMSHWHADAEDRYEAWHWTNVAISLCQTAGFHKAPAKSTRRFPAFTEIRERLCRRIWWQCVVRDRWLSMVKGRPLRIQLVDCDLSGATAEDLEFDLRQIDERTTSMYFPFNIKRISQLWAEQVKVSILLGDILTHNSRDMLPEPPQDQLQRLMELETADWNVSDLEPAHPLEKLCVYHVRLLINAAKIALWRPRIMLSSTDAASGSTHQEAVERSRNAAISSNTTLEEIIGRDLVKYLKPQTITVLVPAMQIHLLDCKSSVTSIRMLGTNRLLLCMQLLTELKETYWPAEFVLRLFQRAHEKIIKRHKLKNGTQQSVYLPLPMTETATATTTALPTQSFDQLTPQSLSSEDEMLLNGFDWEGYPDMKAFWDESNFVDDGAVNTFFSANDFMTGLATDVPYIP